MNNFGNLSIRSMQALGALAVQTYCSRNSINHPSIDAFIEHLWSVVDSPDLIEWERQGATLDLSGWGDPLPEALAEKLTDEEGETLQRLCDNACEISLSHMYGATNRVEAEEFLRTVATIAQFDILRSPLLPVVSELSPATGDWGEPLTQEMKQEWQEVAKRCVQTDTARR